MLLRRYWRVLGACELDTYARDSETGLRGRSQGEKQQDQGERCPACHTTFARSRGQNCYFPELSEAPCSSIGS